MKRLITMGHPLGSNVLCKKKFEFTIKSFKVVQVADNLALADEEEIIWKRILTLSIGKSQKPVSDDGR